MPHARRLAQPEDGLGHSDGVDRLGDVVHADDPRASEDTGDRPRDRSDDALAASAIEGLANEVFIGQRDERRVAEGDDFRQAADQFQ